MADLANQPSKAPSILGKLIFIPNFYFIYVIYNLIKSNPQSAVEEFSKLRNFAYLIYVVLFVIIGIFITILQRQDKDSILLVNLSKFLPNLVLSLILTTFSYAIANYINDFLNVING